MAGIHLKEIAQNGPRFTAAITVRAQGDVASRNEGPDLLREGADVVRRGDDGARLILEAGLDIALLLFRPRMETVRPLDGETLASQLGEAGHAEHFQFLSRLFQMFSALYSWWLQPILWYIDRAFARDCSRLRSRRGEREKIA